MSARFTLREKAMAVEIGTLTPQQRLALSRRALVNQLRGGERPDYEDEPSTAGRPLHESESAGHGFAWTSIASNVAARWWRRHPANAVSQLARPLLDRYARKEPAKLIAAAAATGALIVMIKPWRLLSITAVIAAVLKTSDVADVVTTLMHKTSRKDPP
jgi:hypothetical protein